MGAIAMYFTISSQITIYIIGMVLMQFHIALRIPPITFKSSIESFWVNGTGMW